MNKKLLTILSLVIAISSCKKNDDNSGGTVNGSPQITAAAFVSSHSAGSKLGGYRLDSGSIKFPSPIANTFFNLLNK